MAITLWYWKIPGRFFINILFSFFLFYFLVRASLAYVLLKVGGLDVKYIDDDEQEVKESYWTKSPFGQLPYLIDEKNGGYNHFISTSISFNFKSDFFFILLS